VAGLGVDSVWMNTAGLTSIGNGVPER
jgi:hypothetical protein